MNTYGCSDGTRLTTSQIDRLVSKAKRDLDEMVLEEYGYLFCVDCKRSDRPLDKSHTISVKYAKETGRSELAFDLDNLKHRCRKCHDILDAKKNNEREQIYNEAK
jgi:hypothetical protein